MCSHRKIRVIKNLLSGDLHFLLFQSGDIEWGNHFAFQEVMSACVGKGRSLRAVWFKGGFKVFRSLDFPILPWEAFNFHVYEISIMPPDSKITCPKKYLLPFFLKISWYELKIWVVLYKVTKKYQNSVFYNFSQQYFTSVWKCFILEEALVW